VPEQFDGLTWLTLTPHIFYDCVEVTRFIPVCLHDRETLKENCPGKATTKDHLTWCCRSWAVGNYIARR